MHSPNRNLEVDSWKNRKTSILGPFALWRYSPKSKSSISISRRSLNSFSGHFTRIDESLGRRRRGPFHSTRVDTKRHKQTERSKPPPSNGTLDLRDCRILFSNSKSNKSEIIKTFLPSLMKVRELYSLDFDLQTQVNNLE